jgi:putative membrane protein insertion efficiency factor
MVRVYRAGISPLLTAVSLPFGLGCRFTPTCSQYALEAVRQHGAVKGTVLATGRLCRCHPWGGSGYDPVPGHTARSAELHSAVSRICNPPGVANSEAISGSRFAECNSAIQQIENLRYGGGAELRHSAKE